MSAKHANSQAYDPFASAAARFNTPGYNPFAAAKLHSADTTDAAAIKRKKDDVAAKNLAHRKGITLEAARAEIKNAYNREWMAAKRKATRVNKHDPICAPTGLTAQAKEIRWEMGR